MRAASALLVLACVPGMVSAQKKATACVFDTAAHRDTTGIVFSVRVRRSTDTATILTATRALAAVLRDHFHQPASSSALFPIRNWLRGTPVVSSPEKADNGVWGMAFEFVVGPDTYLRGLKVMRTSRDSATDAAFIAGIWEADRVADRGVFSSVVERGDSTGVVEFRDGPGVAAVMLQVPRILLDAEVTPRKFAQLKRPKGYPAPGEVTLLYAVNEDGTVDPESMRVIRATNQRFAAAARETLLKSTFRPARAGGCPIKELVEQSVVFGWEQ